MAKPRELSKAERRKFLELLDKTGSRDNGDRVLARLQMNRFVLKVGKDVCQRFYDDYKGKVAKRKK